MRMKPLKDIKIRTKLVLLGTVCLLGLIVLGKESISTASRIKQAGDEVSAIWMNAVIVAEELNTVTSDYRIKESRHAITTDPKLMESLELEMDRLRGEIEKNLRNTGVFLPGKRTRRLLQKQKLPGRVIWNTVKC